MVVGEIHPAGDPTARTNLIPLVAWKEIIVVICAHNPRKLHRLQIIHTGNALRFRLRLAERGKQQAREYGNNRDDNQQLNQGELKK